MKTRSGKYYIDENKDRLSDLPDCILLIILSILNAKQVVQTSILSTRWKNLWKNLPILSLRSTQFKTYKAFTKFMSCFLSLRDASTALHIIDLNRKGIMEPRLLEKILKYGVSHDVQRLRINGKCDIQHFPSCLFSCHTLTSLHFFVHPPRQQKILFPSSLNLPSLTRLFIGNVIFHGGVDPFSGFPSLDSLAIFSFQIMGEKNLCISSTTLVELVIQVLYEPNNNAKIELSTPSLRTFVFMGTPFPILCSSHLSSIEHIKLFVYKFQNYAKAPSVLLSWLLELADIKWLEVDLITLQVFKVYMQQ
jgi:hypothetical protein